MNEIKPGSKWSGTIFGDPAVFTVIWADERTVVSEAGTLRHCDTPELFLREYTPIVERWKPVTMQIYFMPDLTQRNEFSLGLWSNDDLDLLRLERGIVFKTPGEAKAISDKILAFVASLHN